MIERRQPALRLIEKKRPMIARVFYQTSRQVLKMALDLVGGKDERAKIGWSESHQND
jgi:hypothetical protein